MALEQKKRSTKPNPPVMVVPAMDPPLSESSERGDLVQALGEALQALKEVKAQRDVLYIVAKAKVAEAKNPIVVVNGSVSVDQAEKLAAMVRELGSDGVIAVLAEGNSLFTLSDADLSNLGLMRVGLAH
jgi:uncharacterized protein (DUF1697 family)